MKPVVYYDRKTRAWWGFWADANDYQMHDAVFGNDRDGVLIELGAIKADVRSKYTAPKENTMSNYKIYRASREQAISGITGWICEDANGDFFIGRSAQEALDHFRNYYGL